MAFIGEIDKRATAKDSLWVLVWVKARASDHVAMLQVKAPIPVQAGQPGSQLTRRGQGPGSPWETPVWGACPGALRAPGLRLLRGGRRSPREAEWELGSSVREGALAVASITLWASHWSLDAHCLSYRVRQSLSDLGPTIVEKEPEPTGSLKGTDNPVKKSL